MIPLTSQNYLEKIKFTFFRNNKNKLKFKFILQMII